MEDLKIITEINSQAEFYELLNNNPGITIIKLSAVWCAPCQLVRPAIQHYISQLPRSIQIVVIDIDECHEVYSLLQNKRVVNGIPAVLAYYKNNTSVIPDDSVIGADFTEIDLFFNRIFKVSKEIS